jgi:hypothetical protein
VGVITVNSSVIFRFQKQTKEAVVDKNDLAKAEELGVEGVLLEMAKGGFGHPGSQLRFDVENWIKHEQTKKLSLNESVRDQRERETLEIAKQANAIAIEARQAAKDQARWTFWSFFIAMIAAAIAAASWIFPKSSG